MHDSAAPDCAFGLHVKLPLVPAHPVFFVSAFVTHRHESDPLAHARAPVDVSVEHENETPAPLHAVSPVRAVVHVKLPLSPAHASIPFAVWQLVHTPETDDVGEGDGCGACDGWGAGPPLFDEPPWGWKRTGTTGPGCSDEGP